MDGAGCNKVVGCLNPQPKNNPFDYVGVFQGLGSVMWHQVQQRPPLLALNARLPLPQV